MVCRNKDKAEEARADIVKETGNKVECDAPLYGLLLAALVVTLIWFIAGGLCPHPGPVRDQEGLGVRRGLQEKVQSPQCAGELSLKLPIFFGGVLIHWLNCGHFPHPMGEDQ